MENLFMAIVMTFISSLFIFFMTWIIGEIVEEKMFTKGKIEKSFVIQFFTKNMSNESFEEIKEIFNKSEIEYYCTMRKNNYVFYIHGNKYSTIEIVNYVMKEFRSENSGYYYYESK